MMTTPSPSATTPAAPAPHRLSPAITLLMAAACGALAANLYYAQPLIALIGPDIGLSPAMASFIVTLTQIGYGLGLVMLVPLGDIVENKKLILATLAVTTVALALGALAPNAVLFLVLSLFIGFSSSVAQLLVPMAASMTDDATRGRVVGNVVSGLMVGILLARPLSGVLSDWFGWRGVFAFSVLLMIVIGTLLTRFLPKRVPTSGHSYGELMGSLWTILRDTPLLRRRGLYQFALFGDFTLFWTAIPLELRGAPFHLSQSQIAIFALAGAAGALSAPIAGRLADRGFGKIGTGLAIVGTLLAFVIGGIGAASIAALVIAAVVLDFACQANLVFGQRQLYELSPAIRSRLNGLYIAIFFIGGATGSALASPVYAAFGWNGIVAVGIALPALAFLYYLPEGLRKKG